MAPADTAATSQAQIRRVNLGFGARDEACAALRASPVLEASLSHLQSRSGWQLAATSAGMQPSAGARFLCAHTLPVFDSISQPCFW